MGGPQAAPGPAPAGGDHRWTGAGCQLEHAAGFDGQAAAAPGRCACWEACLPGLCVTASGGVPRPRIFPGREHPGRHRARSRRARLLSSPLKLTCQRPQAASGPWQCDRDWTCRTAVAVALPNPAVQDPGLRSGQPPGALQPWPGPHITDSHEAAVLSGPIITTGPAPGPAPSRWLLGTPGGRRLCSRHTSSALAPAATD
jgi:hypothetical protein